MTPATPLPTDDRRQLAARHYSTRNKAQTPPTVGAFEQPLVGCCINEEWMAHILGGTATLEWPDAWKGTPTEIQFALEQIVEIQAHMNCECGSGCRTCNANAGASYLLQLDLEFTVNGLNGIAPNRPDTTFDTDSGDVGDDKIQRENALCLAVTDYINTVLDDAIGVAGVSGLRVLAGAGAVVVGVGVMAGVAFAAGVALLGVVFQRAANNVEIREDIMCCMLEGLTGATVTQASFMTALDNCSFPAFSDLEIMRFLVEETLQDTSNWFSFIRAIGAYFSFAGIDPIACFCHEEGFYCDFTIDKCDWVPASNAFGFLATYDEDEGWDNGPSGVINHFVSIIATFDEDIAFTEVHIFVAYGSGDDLQYEFELLDEFDVTLLLDSITVDPAETNHKFTFSEETGVRKMRIKALKTGLETDFPGHIIAVQVEADIAPFPVQPI